MFNHMGEVSKSFIPIMMFLSIPIGLWLFRGKNQESLKDRVLRLDKVNHSTKILEKNPGLNQEDN